MNRFLLFIGLLLSLFFVQCSDNDFDNMVLEKEMSKETRSMGFYHYPGANIIMNQKKYRMQELWNYTIMDALDRKPREYGLVFYATPKQDDSEFKITDSGVQKGNIIYIPDPSEDPNTEKEYPIQGEIDLEYYTNGNYCGFFHTHYPLTPFPDRSYYRLTGPTGFDIEQVNSVGCPGFVYDYSAPKIRGTHAENEPAKIYVFGSYYERRLQDN